MLDEGEGRVVLIDRLSLWPRINAADAGDLFGHREGAAPIISIVRSINGDVELVHPDDVVDGDQ